MTTNYSFWNYGYKNFEKLQYTNCMGCIMDCQIDRNEILVFKDDCPNVDDDV